MTKNFGGDIGRKYARIDLDGRDVLKNKPERVLPYPGFDAESERMAMENRFIVAAQFEAGGSEAFEKRVIAPLNDIANKNGIVFLVAGHKTENTFPIHSTIGQGKVGEEIAKKAKDSLFQRLRDDQRLKAMVRKIENLEIIYDYILVDKTNVLLTASDIPVKIITLRQELADYYRDHGLEPLVIENLLHITVGRMTGFPDGESQKAEAFNRYRLGLIDLRHAISRDPLTLRVSDVFLGKTGDLLKREYS